jgi:hypothetical protein
MISGIARQLECRVSMQNIATTFLSLLALLVLASEGVCGAISVCDGRYEIPLFADASTKSVSEANSCGAVIYAEEGSGNQSYIKYLYGYISYKEKIIPEKMQRFQNFIARFVNKMSGHSAGEFKATDPIFYRIPGTDVYTIVQKFDQAYDGLRFSGTYEIITRAEGDSTNSYFIEYPSEGGPPAFYDRFKEWALK